MKTPGVFVDVGANLGDKSLFMSRYAKEIHAFEPFPPVLEKLRRHLAINGIRNVTVYPVGLGAKPDKIPFFQPPDVNLAMGSFHSDYSRNNVPYKELDIVTGDEALKGVHVDLIKIDVEGFEKEVLQGLRRTLETHRPIVLFEVSYRPAESFGFKSKEEIFSVFPDGYRFMAFDRTRDFLRTETYRLLTLSDEHFREKGVNDVVAYPAEKGF
jgi:FkbM family methyltransferase